MEMKSFGRGSHLSLSLCNCVRCGDVVNQFSRRGVYTCVGCGARIERERERESLVVYISPCVYDDGQKKVISTNHTFEDKDF
jgi:hypothetical protein